VPLKAWLGWKELWQVTLAATLRAFRYVDEDEIAARRKAARAAKKGKG